MLCFQNETISVIRFCSSYCLVKQMHKQMFFFFFILLCLLLCASLAHDVKLTHSHGFSCLIMVWPRQNMKCPIFTPAHYLFHQYRKIKQTEYTTKCGHSCYNLSLFLDLNIKKKKTCSNFL